MKKMFLLLATLFAAALCQAQFIGFVSQQSVTSLPFNATTCTAALAAGLVVVPNIGQGAHFATAFPGTTTTLLYSIQGSYDGVNYFDISDAATGTVNSSGLTGVTGTGYYPAVGIRISACTPAASTISVRYSGISMPPGAPLGTNQQGQLVKNLATQSPANASLSTLAIRSPFGSSAGMLQFVYTGAAGPAGSTLSVGCGSNSAFVPVVFGPFPILTTTALVTQTFPLPATSCDYFLVNYATGGASAALFNLDFAFSSVVEPADVCENYPKLSVPVSAGAAGTTQIVPASSTLSIYGCGYQVSQAVLAGTIQWEYGSGALCAGGTTLLSGAMQTIVGQPFTLNGPGTVMKAPVGNAFCLVTTGAGATVAGIFDYVLAP